MRVLPLVCWLAGDLPNGAAYREVGGRPGCGTISHAPPANLRTPCVRFPPSAIPRENIRPQRARTPRGKGPASAQVLRLQCGASTAPVRIPQAALRDG